MDTIKQYFKGKVIATDYLEVPYIEYREDGTIKETGTEDFSKKRYLTTIHTWLIFTPIDELIKGKKRKWKKIFLIRTTSAIHAKKIAEFKYPGIELRIERY